MTRQINKPAIDWGKWHFEDVEPYFVELIKDTGVEYDPKHPLSVLPPDAAQKALDFLGIGYKDLAGLMNSSYETVAGWFRPSRNPSRRTVVDNIFPALCELCLYRMKGRTYKFERAVYDHYVVGKPLPEPLVREVEERAITILCTGRRTINRDITRDHSENLDAYRRSVLRLATEFLEGDELADFARTALGFISAHVAKPSQKTNPDALTNLVNGLSWDLWEDAGSEPGYVGQDNGLSPFAPSFRLKAHRIDIDVPTYLHYLDSLSPIELESLRESADIRLGHRHYDDIDDDELEIDRWLADEDW